MAKIQDIRNKTKRTNGTRSISQIKYIVRHHSATESGNFDSFWDHWNGAKGWGTGGYHEIILRDGTVQLCYDPNEITNGVGGYNTPCYHICVVGNGSFTASQEKAWGERAAYNMQRLKVNVNHVKGHNEMPGAATSCPGINMDNVRSRLKGAAVKPSKPKSKDAKNPKKGNVGPNVLAIQKLLNKAGYKVAEDSSFGPAMDKAIRKFQGDNNLVEDGQAGPATQKALKSPSKSKVTVPNVNLYLTSPQMHGADVTQLQEALASIYFYPEKGAKNNGIDGYFGPNTADAVRRFQLTHGLEADGSYGPATRAKLIQALK